MEWEIRIALIIGGLVLVAYIFFDFNKKKKIQKENERLKRQFSNIGHQIDRAGFDSDGVGKVRTTSEGQDDSSAPMMDKNTAEKNAQNQIIDNQVKENQVKESQISKNQANENKQDFFQNGQTENSQQAQLVLSLLLKAPQGHHYKGKDFLPIFLSQGLRHGDMDIFHRYKNAGADPGPVIFSLANGIAPGTFSMHNIEAFETPVLALFVTLPVTGDPQIAYNAMVKTIKLLKSELDGEIMDETQSKYTEQIHNHRLDQIQEFNRKNQP